MLKTLTCGCRHPDDVECLAIQHGLFSEDVHDGDACGCACHDFGEDGESAWDDEDEVEVADDAAR